MRVLNRHGRGRLLLTCEHASNRIPHRYHGLGVGSADLSRHIAWDLGALGLAERLSQALDAPLVHGTYSRLLLDLNRAVDAHDSIVGESEGTLIAGNVGLDLEERERRRLGLYQPFHEELDGLIATRLAAGWRGAVLSIHSFTPVFHAVQRPWHVGVLSHNDRRLADALLAELRIDTSLCVGDNQPYSPRDGVYHSMARHGEAHALPCAMIEMRNDLIAHAEGQAAWAARLQHALTRALEAVLPP